MFTFNEKTNDKVKAILSSVYNSGQRIRIVYGDTETGKDWLEENDVTGTIGRSTGVKKVPLLIANSRSYGGGAILDHCIIKIVTTDGKYVLYEHETYNQPKLEIKDSDHKDYNFLVTADGNAHARFKSEKSAKNYVSFLQCKRMCK